MANPISKKISVKYSIAKPLCGPWPGYKTCELVVYKSSLVSSKKNLVKRHFPYIDTSDHEGPVVINAIRDLTVGLFEHLYIISPTDVDKRLYYTQFILRGSAL